MNVINDRSAAIQLFITDVNCMFDDGDEGSNLSLFNNALVKASSSLPESGSQYIEAKNSGGCFGADSTFTLKVEDAENHAIIGSVAFNENLENYEVQSNSNKDVIDVNINNSGDQARITVTVEASLCPDLPGCTAARPRARSGRSAGRRGRSNGPFIMKRL
jgi:hypothetical protein